MNKLSYTQLYEQMAALSAARGWPTHRQAEQQMAQYGGPATYMAVLLGMADLRGLTTTTMDPTGRIRHAEVLINDTLPQPIATQTLGHELLHVWRVAAGHDGGNAPEWEEYAAHVCGAHLLYHHGLALPDPADHHRFTVQYTADLSREQMRQGWREGLATADAITDALATRER